jgi:hypothetical protein
MTIELTDGVYYSAVWFIAGPDRDWMCMTFKAPGQPWSGKCRFRYYKDRAQTHEDSEASWMAFKGQVSGHDGEAAIARVTDEVAGMCSAEWGGAEIHKVFLKTDSVAEVLRLLEREPWWHVTERERAP